MSTINLLIIIVAVIAVVTILGVRAGREHGTKIEHRPPPDDPRGID